MASHAITNNTVRQGVQLKWLLGKVQYFLTPCAHGSTVWLGLGRHCGRVSANSGTAILRTSCGCLQNGKISIRPLLTYVRSPTRSMSTRCYASCGHATRISNENSVGNNRGVYQYLKSKQNRQHWSVRKYDHLELPSSQLQSLSAFSTWSRKYKDVNEKDDTKEAKAKEQYQYKNWRTLLTVPNFLTVSRVILTPYLGHLVLTESYPAACGLFLYAGITDVLDGWIARRFPSQATPVGSFMDPLADKFLVSTLFITLTMVNLIPVPLTCLVVFRDVSLIAAAFYVRTISLPPPVTLSAIFDISNQTAELKPTLISKANTGIQLGLVAMTLAAPVVNCVDHPALQALWFITAATTLWSGIGYIFAKDTFKIYKSHRLKQKQS